MLFRELTKTYGAKLLTSLNIEESESIVFGVPGLEPKIKMVPETIQRPVTCFCQTENTKNCSICHGTKQISQNGAFLKFLEAVIEYKIGKSEKSADGAKPLEEIKVRQQEVNTRVLKKEQAVSVSHVKGVAMSLQVNYNREMIVVEQGRLACSAPFVTHKGVECDGCKSYPLIGTRFQCTKCDSFDLCSFCHADHGSQHGHSFRRVEFPKNEIMKRTLKEQFKKTRSFQRIVQ